MIRARNSLTQFVDASRLSDDEAARLIRELEVDIAVDLTGFTQGCRPGIFGAAPRPCRSISSDFRRPWAFRTSTTSLRMSSPFRLLRVRLRGTCSTDAG